ncbi:MAG: MotA/TolQ/ExbB proton channel family protein [Sphingomonadaceae bacterium]|uniref:MotA/TolQ/ExbB proton channel family protein n=1 Tax=Thermaurantiacus sp. TaxID=2820283 RepID=UPI00298F10D5|nr:MotA/TolQ/ExbB proton channel family protein [Thermaurantiacus sp.]MCS6986792.1 MotA/TolQ/ExbB proton channel family protein [Sphingomonadaceae bacterium]MDW8413945.1 MotA/TolQ/ExbB proton channel family protein [Thermaurantiacus sp.]
MGQGIRKALTVAGAALPAVFWAPAAWAAEVVEGENPYGLIPALKQGGPIAWGLFAILIIMSVVTWYIFFTKWFQQKKLLDEAVDVEKKVWSAPSLKEGAAKLDKDSAFRQIAEDGLRAFDHHEGRLTDQIDQHEWVTMTLNRTTGLIGARLQSGLAFLASTGATAPFIGLLGTVVGIYRALINIGIAGQASIDKVAGPVGEALIMTALGLAVAVPAVLIYNYLNGRNKLVMEKINTFAADVHGYLLSGARMAKSTPAPAPAPAAAKP